MLPEDEVERARALCRARSSEALADQVRIELEVDRGALTIVEVQASWHARTEWTRLPVARLRFAKGTGLWTLYAPGRDARWRRYEGIGPAASVGPLLREVDRDPTGAFWG
ncbi:DUF3024 domain-containing protein [Patulibacter medicamentivorans]|uniref:DUF3024 domain-containing protein n=1 Tax=Patulibacter medicamentivorans TaxID=1097667 RepID=UPI0011103DBA|nr:DUF3024 domain-containing protein [Patulibacter medicamentivorans]